MSQSKKPFEFIEAHKEHFRSLYSSDVNIHPLCTFCSRKVAESIIEELGMKMVPYKPGEVGPKYGHIIWGGLHMIINPKLKGYAIYTRIYAH